MKNITLSVLTLFFSFTLNAQVCQPSVPSSGQGSHELTITSSDADFVICPTDCVSLTADFLEVGETNSYAVRSIPFNPSFSFGDTLSDTSLTTDDVWSGIINWGFDFLFYGGCYDQGVLTTNGAVSFDTANAGNFHFWTPAAGALIPNNADAALRDGNIFGAIHDIDPSVAPGTFAITYGVKGVAPFRVFTFSFFNAPQFDCNSQRTSQMIMIYEATNVVEVYLYYKPVCTTWEGGRAALGIQNNAGTQGLAAPGRNTAQWTAGDATLANGEAWQFYPTGAPTYDITWYDDSTGAVIGTNKTINVCPLVTTTYTAELSYTNPTCGGVSTVTRCVTITVDDTPADPSFNMTATCDGGTATITGDVGGTFNFSPDPGDGATIDPATGTVTGGTSGATYTSEYTVLNACGDPFSSTASVTVLTSADASFTLDPT